MGILKSINYDRSSCGISDREPEDKKLGGMTQELMTQEGGVMSSRV